MVNHPLQSNGVTPLNPEDKDVSAANFMDGVSKVEQSKLEQSVIESQQSNSSMLDTHHNEHFVRNLFIPYMTDVFKDLAERANPQN